MGKAGKLGSKNKSSRNTKSSPILDLHGRKVEEIFDAVELFLRRHADSPQVRIMSGKGTGKVRDEVTRYLKLANYSWHFERLGNGSANEGVLIVHMD